MSQLASQLGVGVGVQTLYDLRSQGRGPRGFRVGRELRFRVSEVDSWLAWKPTMPSGTHTAGGDAHRSTPNPDRHARRDQHPTSR